MRGVSTKIHYLIKTLKLAYRMAKCHYVEFVEYEFPVGFMSEKKQGLQVIEHGGRKFLVNVRVSGGWFSYSRPVIELKGAAVEFDPKVIFEDQHRRASAGGGA